MSYLFPVILVLLSGQVFTVNAQFRTDERFELSGIAAYLAGYPEYSMCQVSSYRDAVDSCFRDYAEHDLLKFMRQLRETRGIGFDALTTAASMLVIENGGIGLSPLADTAMLYKADPRWSAEVFSKYVSLLSRFYRDTDFGSFYSSFADLYAAGEELVNANIRIDTAWFSSFYGQAFGRPELYISFINGPSNYGISDNGTMPGYGIVLGVTVDPFYADAASYYAGIGSCQMLYLTVHELCHNFSNREFYRNSHLFKDAGERLFLDKDISERMRRLAYGSPVLMSMEWFNELCTAMYFKEKGMVYPQKHNERSWMISSIITDNIAGKFFWLGSSIDMMSGFYRDRDKYMHISDYIPVIAEYYDSVSMDIPGAWEEYLSDYPEVVDYEVDSTYSTDTLYLRFKFPEDMVTTISGAAYHNDPDVTTLTLIPGQTMLYSDSRTYTVKVAKAGLKKGVRYGGALKGSFFMNNRCYRMLENYYFDFIFR